MRCWRTQPAFVKPRSEVFWLMLEGNVFRAVAVHSKQGFYDYLQRNPLIDLRDHPGIPLDRLAKTKQLVHIPRPPDRSVLHRE